MDSTGRLWLATDHFNWVYIYDADYPFSTFTGPIILTDQTGLGDVNQIVAFPNHTIGVFWGNGLSSAGASKSTWTEQIRTSGWKMNPGAGRP